MGETHLIGSESHLSAASCAAPDVAVVAKVSDAIRKLGLEAYLARRIQVNTSLLLSVNLLLYLVLKADDLLLFVPKNKNSLSNRLLSFIITQQLIIFTSRRRGLDLTW